MQYKDIRILRIFHVAAMLTFAEFLDLIFQWENGYWVPITVASIMLPLDSGLIISRANARHLGTIAGLVISVPLWLILNWDFRLFYFVVPLMLALLNYYQNFDYLKTVAFITICIEILVEYVTNGSGTFYNFFQNRFAATFIGMAVCISFEFLIFYRYRYSYYDLKFVTLDLINLLETNLATFKQSIFVPGKKIQLQSALTDFNQELVYLRERKKSVLTEFSNETDETRIFLDDFAKLVDQFRLTLIAGYYLLDSIHENKIFALNRYTNELEDILATMISKTRKIDKSILD